jgi:hypothetical protein
MVIPLDKLRIRREPPRGFPAADREFVSPQVFHSPSRSWNRGQHFGVNPNNRLGH